MRLNACMVPSLHEQWHTMSASDLEDPGLAHDVHDQQLHQSMLTIQMNSYVLDTFWAIRPSARSITAHLALCIASDPEQKALSDHVDHSSYYGFLIARMALNNLSC